MRLPPEGARWLVTIRWAACALVFLVTGLSSAVFGVIEYPLPLYAIGAAMLAYNTAFYWEQNRREAFGNGSTERRIFVQVLLDLLALTFLLYFSDISRNPFLVYFLFHMIIGGMYLRWTEAYFLAGLWTALVGGIMLLEYLQWIPAFPLRYGGQQAPPLHGLHLLAVFIAFASSMGMTVYFTTSIRRYVDRAHAELRQKEKMVGIGQLVAGIGHQIANPLDGAQNCLRRIGERVKDNPHLMEYVHMMADALERIERTAKRVQAFAQPRGITLQSTDVNAAVEATLAVLGTSHGRNIRIQTDLRHVPPVEGDPYTLQEVLFNLCTNALAAMPTGGTLTLRTRALGSEDEDQMDSVAIEVEDTGVGIPRANLDRIFEPFFTTRADSGGTGLGLGLCRMLISEMGGRIEVRSVLGQGTTFTVILNPFRQRTFQGR